MKLKNIKCKEDKEKYQTKVDVVKNVKKIAKEMFLKKVDVVKDVKKIAKEMLK